MYIVLHSTDPYLLARMSTDLQFEYYNINREWCEGNGYNPFQGVCKNEWMLIGKSSGVRFHNHNCIGCSDVPNPFSIELSEENYISTLQFILENANK